MQEDTNILHLYTGAVMRDLTVEQYLNGTDQHSTNHEGNIKQVSHHLCRGRMNNTSNMPTITLAWLVILPYYYHCIAPHMSACHSTRMYSPLKTMLGKIKDRYQAYCTTYKMHTMATCHGGAGQPLDRGINFPTEDPEPTDIDNESTPSSDATIALGGPEAEGHPKYPVYNNHNKLTALMRELNNLHQ